MIINLHVRLIQSMLDGIQAQLIVTRIERQITFTIHKSFEYHSHRDIMLSASPCHGILKS